MTLDLRQQLSQAIAPLSQSDAEMIAMPSTQITDYPAPFLKTHRLYTIFNESIYTKPVTYHLGFAPPSSVYWLPASPQNFISMAEADGVNITTKQIALMYALTYREVTRSWSKFVYTISSFEEIQFRTQLKGEMLDQQEALKKRYTSVIIPPHVQSIDAHYRVTLYAIVNQNLEYHRLIIAPDGNIEDRKVILEQEMPLICKF